MNYQPYNQQLYNNFPYQPYVQQPINQVANTNCIPTSTLNGRFVGDFNEIKPDEIPMNGTQAVFVQNDLNKICLKKWSANGSIDTSIYELVQQKQPNVFDSIDYDLLEKRISKLETLVKKGSSHD